MPDGIPKHHKPLLLQPLLSLHLQPSIPHLGWWWAKNWTVISFTKCGEKGIHPKPQKVKTKPRNGKEGDPNHERAPKPFASIHRPIFTAFFFLPQICGEVAHKGGPRISPVKINLCIEATGFGARSWFGSPSFLFWVSVSLFGGFRCVPFSSHRQREDLAVGANASELTRGGDWHDPRVACE